MTGCELLTAPRGVELCVELPLFLRFFPRRNIPIDVCKSIRGRYLHSVFLGRPDFLMVSSAILECLLRKRAFRAWSKTEEVSEFLRIATILVYFKTRSDQRRHLF
jgi:hypothetical protein